MHVLYRKLNFRNIKLVDQRSGEKVGVLRRDGTYEFVPWLGFINRKHAKKSAGMPVKLKISRVDGVDLQPGEFVQGCLVSSGVYAVIDSSVVILRDSDH